MSKFSAEVFETAFLCVGSQNPLREFWTKEQRESNAGQEPPMRVDSAGNPLVAVDFMRTVQEFGRDKPVLFAVSMPQNKVPNDLQTGYYSLVDASVQVYADRKNPGQIRESWSARGMVASESVEL